MSDRQSGAESELSDATSTRRRLLRMIGRISVPARIAIAMGSLIVGVLIVLAPIGVHAISQLTGIGFVLVGLATVLAAVNPDAPPKPALHILGGIAIVIIGAIMALWPVAGAPFLAYLTSVGLMLHGLLSALVAIFGRGDQRITAVILGLATILMGVLTLSWPVLTLTLFRFAIGFWLILLGLQLIFELLGSLRRRTPKANSDRPASPAARTHRPGRFSRWVRTIGASLALVCAAALVWGSGVVLGGVALPEPDAFYTAPSEVPRTPGQLIRSEPLTVGVPAGAQAWKILYTTTHADGSPAVSSGTVIAPVKRGSEPLPLLTVAHGTTGVAPKCAPSLSATPFADGAGAALEQMVAEHGWAAVISDYIGLGTGGTHPYLIGGAEARNSLDASRAAMQLGDLNLSHDTVVWGHSQGGQASLWIGQIAGKYAPEFTIKGVGAFAPASNLYGLADADKNTAPGKTVSAYIAATWNKIYPELELDQHLTPGSAGQVDKISNLCFNGTDALSAILIGTQVPNQVFPDSLLTGPFGDKLRAQSPTGPWPAPVLVAQGLSDPLVLPQMQKDWVQERCAAGIPIDFRTFEGRDHVSLVAADSPLTPQLVQWTLDRWDGEPATPNCGKS